MLLRKPPPAAGAGAMTVVVRLMTTVRGAGRGAAKPPPRPPITVLRAERSMVLRELFMWCRPGFGWHRACDTVATAGCSQHATSDLQSRQMVTSAHARSLRAPADGV